MIFDHLVGFDNEVQAQTDPVVGNFYVEGVWQSDICFPGQRAWDPDYDSISSVTDPITGIDIETVIHQYFPYWYITVSLPEVSQEIQDHPTCRLIWDRINQIVIFSSQPPGQMRKLQLEPVPAGSQFPIVEP